jgi:hypothetical protein
MKIKIKILDTAFAHCNYSNNPLPPLQSCEWIEWDRDISNLKSDETLFFTESNILNPLVNTHKGKKIAWLLECRALNGNLYHWLEKNHDKFDLIISHDIELISKCPNGSWIPFGGCWIHKSDWKLYDKSKEISIVASEKNYLEGHKMRHNIIDSYRSKIDLFGRGYNKIENKIDSLRDYKYQIVIENAKIDNYFTEKIIDCFVTGTVPIYWGSSSIDKVFDERGMIIVDSLDSLSFVLENIETYDYSIFSEGKAENFEIAKRFILSEDSIYEKHKNLL